MSTDPSIATARPLPGRATGGAASATAASTLPPASSRRLEADKVVATAETLHRRIDERFPSSGLSRVAEQVVGVSREAAALAEWLASPVWWLRATIAVTIAVMLGAVVGAIVTLDVRMAVDDVSDLFQGIESAINDVIFLALGILFLVTWENRRKRKRALAALHELRSLAHILDMHQLTKDPERLVGRGGSDTPSSPERTMTRFELTRYLDYCSEALALLSKVGALYVERFSDPVTLEAVNEIETLCNGLARKIWQKIMIIDRIVAREGGAEVADDG